ncbi:MAG: hypothetical protein KBS60_00350, partial [Phascolarctobacterium sp.]|nr:hypothetical protein [Candidatus Phascolarctobacterium caballi]
MSFNVKKKVMLALLAGGMLCANSAFAYVHWYGTAGGFVTDYLAAAKTGVNLEITDSTIVEGDDVSSPVAIYGGYDYDDSGSVTGNSITFNTTLTIKDNAEIYGGVAVDNPVTGNEVKIRNGIFGTNVCLYGGSSSDGNANENIVEVSGGTFMAGSKIYGGYSSGGDANNNKVYFEGCTFSAGSGILNGGCSEGGTANGNDIYILGDTEVISSFGVLAGVGITAARGNNVYIGNEDATTVFNNLKFLQLFGGLLGSDPDHLVADITGNVLHVRTAKCSVSAVGAFDTFNFTLPASIQNNDKILTVTDELGVNFLGGTATVNVKAANGVKLNKDDVITLVDSGDTSDTFVGG